MSGRNRQIPDLSEKGRRGREARRARQADALRANLRKRKAQTRDRAESTDPSASGAGVDSAVDLAENSPSV